MIKIKFNLSDTAIEFKPYNFYNITIENIEYYRKFLSWMYFDYIPENLATIYINNDNINADDKCYSIINLLDLDLNTKKNMNALNKIIKKTYYDDLKSDLDSLKEKASSIVKRIALDLDISLTMNDDIKTDDLFKIMDIRFSESKETFIEQFLDYIFVINELQNKNIFFILHMKEFFSAEEIEKIVKEVSYKEIIIINIETHEFSKQISCEKKIIIDKDCCLLI